MRSAVASDRPFSVVSSSRTADHGSLSSLSMAEHTARNLAAGTPASCSVASSRPRWLSLMVKSPMGSDDRISAATDTTSASGIMGAYTPATSKSHW